ncbi:hypothetical protein QYF61_019824 [Mycteria americana]|uniref:Uncharacterized protein n=1 Tax=Mycteria americana TaxID=33587 RepID=A0AAN7NI10_MYCAM|nr:hypothetical protein QYF61_019824 [Mycteria americana]
MLLHTSPNRGRAAGLAHIINMDGVMQTMVQVTLEKRNCMISGSKVRLHRKITEPWFAYAGEKTCKAKAKLELKLASVVLGNKKGFLKYVNSKTRSKENIGPILVEDGTKKKQRHSMLFFASFFNNTDRPWTARSSELEDHDCGNSDFPLVDAEIVRDQLYQLNIHKPMGPDGIHPRVLKELVDVTAAPLSIIYQRS